MEKTVLATLDKTPHKISISCIILESLQGITPWQHLFNQSMIVHAPSPPQNRRCRDQKGSKGVKRGHLWLEMDNYMS